MSEDEQKQTEPVKVQIVKKPLYKRWWAMALIAIVAISAISSLASSDEEGGASKESSNGQVTEASQQKTEQNDDAAGETEEKSYGVGDDIQVGEVKWKVLNAPTKTKEIVSEFDKETASGVFIIIELQAELTGKESGEVSSSQFKIIDSQDRKFETNDDGEIALSMEDKETFMMTQVNPNVPVTGFTVFDIPEDATGLKLEIGDLRMFGDETGLVDLGI